MAALEYAGWGWPVFPLSPGRKTPAIAKEDGGNGHLDATTDEGAIRDWWSADPTRNIGVSAGAAGLFVVDVDPRNGGDETLRDLMALHGRDWLNTVSVLTPSGGAHYYYRVASGISLKGGNGLLGVGIDAKSMGGYVVAPPSRTAAGAYAWEGDLGPDSAVIALVPDWIVKHFGPTSSAARTTSAGLPDTITSGARNSTLTSMAGAMRRKGMTAEEMLPSLLEVNQRCDEPLPEREVRGIAESVGRYGPAQPPSPGNVSTLFSLSSLFSPSANGPEWPEVPGPAAFHGLAGEIVRAIEPHSEADPVALLINTLLGFGSLVGAEAFFVVGATRHYPREFAALVGRTSKARKGDSWPPVRSIFADADPGWTARLAGGLSTGEGLIHAVRDAVEKEEPIKEKGRIIGYQMARVDDGVEDKRLLIMESELAKVLKVMERQGNSLSPILRQAWDTGSLRVMTRTNPMVATDAHISLIGHITMEELSGLLPDVEAANGFMNRFLIACVQRSRLLADPVPFQGTLVSQLAGAVDDVLKAIRQAGQMKRDAAASELWEAMYADLSEEGDGMAGAILARAEAHVLRLSMLYALLDGTNTISVPHLTAAAEVWGYCERSVGYIFGDATGDPLADTIFRALKTQGEMTRSDISALLGRHESAARIARALQLLVERGKATVSQRETGGRPLEIWRPVA